MALFKIQVGGNVVLKLLKIVFLASILLGVNLSNAFAAEDSVSTKSNEKAEFTSKGSKIVIKEEKEPSVDVSTLPNIAESTFAPKSKTKSSGDFQTLGIDFARGTISCYVIGSDAFCPWTIQVGGDVITYSNVKVYLERDYGWLNGGWEPYSTFSFNYPIYTPSSTIRNEASFRLPKGSYRVKLGGTFTTLKNGVYSAVANGASYFEIK